MLSYILVFIIFLYIANKPIPEFLINIFAIFGLLSVIYAIFYNIIKNTI